MGKCIDFKPWTVWAGTIAFAVFFGIGTVYQTPAHAQSAAPKQTAVPNTGDRDLASINARRNVLFQRMVEQPEDLDIAFEYAALSVRVGDLEAAIGTLERMLIFAPGLPRLQLELGLLYYRAGAFETARTYLEAGIAAPNVPPNVLARVEQILAGIDTAEKRQKLSGQFRVGLRYQSNANRAPRSADVDLNGLIFQLSQDALGESDLNVYGAASVHFVHELESQGDTFEVDVIGYGAKQFQRHELDLLQGEITAGPAFDMGRFDIDNAKLGVYGIASAVHLAGDFYASAFGVGSRLAMKPSAQASLLLKAEYRRRIFQDTTNAPTGSNRTGDEYRLGAFGSYIVNPNLMISGGIQHQWSTAELDFLAYSETTVFAGPTYAFASPLDESAKAWTASLHLGATLRRYDAPDPVINAAEEQNDNEFFVRTSLTIPIHDEWALLGEAEYRNINSNYDTRKHDNATVTLSAVKKF
ncbi:MAG: surface lipoprotein assembly modifier [Pseudomonadota bacterium]